MTNSSLGTLISGPGSEWKLANSTLPDTSQHFRSAAGGEIRTPHVSQDNTFPSP